MSDEVKDDTVTTPEGVVTEVVDERSELERQRDEYLDALQRLQADFENYRKRVARSSVDAADLAAAHFLSAPSEEAEALDQARGLLLDALAKQGLERIDAVGVDFDPQVHDAVAHVEGEDGPVVDQVLRAGYRWKGSVLRPAMVKVRG